MSVVVCAKFSKSLADLIIIIYLIAIYFGLGGSLYV